MQGGRAAFAVTVLGSHLAKFTMPNGFALLVQAVSAVAAEVEIDVFAIGDG